MALLKDHRWALLALAVTVAGLAGTAQLSIAAGKGKTSRLVGAWRLVSLEEVQPNGTVNTDWMGARPVGLIVYDRSGFMSAQIGRDPRAIWTGPDLEDVTTEGKAKAFDAHYPYFGRYEVDEHAGVVQHHIERSLWPTETGLTYKRSFELTGADRLTLKTPPSEDGSYRRLVWERLKPLE